jgi:hypothetical protein
LISPSFNSISSLLSFQRYRNSPNLATTDFSLQRFTHPVPKVMGNHEVTSHNEGTVGEPMSTLQAINIEEVAADKVVEPVTTRISESSSYPKPVVVVKNYEPQPQSAFLSIPTEVRLRIYGFAFGGSAISLHACQQLIKDNATFNERIKFTVFEFENLHLEQDVLFRSTRKRFSCNSGPSSGLCRLLISTMSNRLRCIKCSAKKAWTGLFQASDM